MITIHITPSDLAEMRFAYRPVLEISLSCRMLRNPHAQVTHQRWVDEARRALHDVEMPYLSAVISARGYIPTFLTPTPMSRGADVEADFTDILATPDDIIRENILTLMDEDGESEMRRYVVAHPREAMSCLIDELRIYWGRTLAHHWSRMMATIEGDVLYRGRLLAVEGPGTLFANLHPTIRYEPGKIYVHRRASTLYEHVDLRLNGDGIQLVPTIFRDSEPMIQVVPGWHPMLAFGVRGTGLWYQKPAVKSLELAVGRGRARVLQDLTTPSTTVELAYRLRISSATASQHLGRLSKAGLAVPRRSGKRVYYHLTERGAALIGLFERVD